MGELVLQLVCYVEALIGERSSLLPSLLATCSGWESYPCSSPDAPLRAVGPVWEAQKLVLEIEPASSV